MRSNGQTKIKPEGRAFVSSWQKNWLEIKAAKALSHKVVGEV